MRKYLALPLIAVVAALILSAQPSHADEPIAGPAYIELAQAQSLMQCMERCIRAEGSAEKATCKSRCAGTPSAFGKQHKKRDCMAVYKSCKRNCASSDKNCQRACKGNLMKCS